MFGSNKIAIGAAQGPRDLKKHLLYGILTKTKNRDSKQQDLRGFKEQNMVIKQPAKIMIESMSLGV